MWDRRRQIVWLAAGLIVGTFVAFSDAHDEDGIFVPRFFVFMESLVLIIIGTLFYLYSRTKQLYWDRDKKFKVQASACVPQAESNLKVGL
jgi:hypothetical protein